MEEDISQDFVVDPSISIGMDSRKAGWAILDIFSEEKDANGRIMAGQ
jgi:hypothetical protein